MIDLGIAILAENETAMQANELRDQITSSTKIDSSYSSNNIPHITLFQNQFPQKNLDKIYAAVKDVCSKQQQMIVKFQSELFLSKFNNVFWNLEISKQLLIFHEQIVNSLNPLREGLMLPRYKECLDQSSTSEKDKAKIREFGVILVKDNWLPHITLLKLDQSSSFDEIAHIKANPSTEMKVLSIVIGKIGFAGDLIEVVHKIKIKGR